MKVERSVVLPAPVDEVWRAVTEPERLSSWLGATVEIDARPGGRVVLSGGSGDRWGTVETLEPGRRLVLRLWERTPALTGARLQFTVEDAEGGARLTVVESTIGAEGGRAGGAEVLAGVRG